MTAEQFQQWLDDVKSSGLAKTDKGAADLLGVHAQRVAQMKKAGTPQVQTDYACAAILAGIRPYGTSASG